MLAKRKSANAGVREIGSGPSKILYKFSKGQSAWVSSSGLDAWKRCRVVNHTGMLVTVRLEGTGSTEIVDLRAKSVYPAEDSGRTSSDMTALHYMNEACILHNLEQRSYKDMPGTFIGSVLVNVNPLKDTKGEEEAKKTLGTPAAGLHPHPYAIAEFAFSQMAFAGDSRRKKKVVSEFVNQSVVATGESGSGKTEASKRVLHHLVSRASGGGQSRIDKRLLTSNPITEAFGNAKTLRNSNSSRFGKFMKLHFEQISVDEIGTPAKFQIASASVQTYLLERTRVSNREIGERNFHIFYYLLAGLDNSMRTALFLDMPKKIGFRYLVPLGEEGTMQATVGMAETRKEILDGDMKGFTELEQAMVEMGFKPAEVLELFKLVAGVMHLGNVAFREKTTSDGDIASPLQVEQSKYDPLEAAAELFGIEPSRLEELLLERTIHTRDGVIAVHRDVSSACFARDAVAKSIYAHIWEQVVARINKSLGDSSRGAGSQRQSSRPVARKTVAKEKLQQSFVGVLDIFGFETFQKNGFEQLLINYTNESLQSVFNRKVFQNELALYRKEGLLLDETTLMLPPNNEPAMSLLAGKLLKDGHSREYKDAILVDIDLQSHEIKPSDNKLLKLFHAKFTNKSPCYLKPHPRVAHEVFIVKHYAGEVAYTTGSFIERNNDQLPNEVNELFATSTSRILGTVFKRLVDLAKRRELQQQQHGRKASNAKTKPQSIVRAFRDQITGLISTLDATACTFIRCVKPNPQSARGSSKDWINRKYVTQQLKHLSIPQTASVLASGLPTRMPYDHLVETYMKALPKSATNRFQNRKVADPHIFVAALFFAFDIDPAIYKLGHTKVFFKNGQISELDRVLQAATNWGTSSTETQRAAVGKRFLFYYARRRWRRTFAKLATQRAFVQLLVVRRAAATTIQAGIRRHLAQVELGHKKEYRAEQERKKREAQALLEKQQAEHARQLKAIEEEQLRKMQERLAQAEKEKEERVKADKAEKAAALEAAKLAARKAKAGKSKEAAAAAAQRRKSSGASSSSMGLSRYSHVGQLNRTPSRVAGRLSHASIASGSSVSRKTKSGSTKAVPPGRMSVMSRLSGLSRRSSASTEWETDSDASSEDTFSDHDESHNEMDEELDEPQRLTRYVSEAHRTTAGISNKGDREAKRSEMLRDAAQYEAMRQKNQEAGNIFQKALHRTPYVQGHLNAVRSKIAEAEEDAPSAQRSKRPSLGGKATHGGTELLSVHQSEVETPVASNKQALSALTAMIDNGEVTAEEVTKMCKDMVKSLARKSFSTHSEASDAGFHGVPVVCPRCLLTNDTIHGLACVSCSADLQVDIIDQTSYFQRPDEEEWAGTSEDDHQALALQLRGGKFFLRVINQTNRYDNHEPVKVFTIECAWQKRVNDKIQMRWLVNKTQEDLRLLESKLAKTLKLPKNLELERHVLVKKGKNKRYSRMKGAISRVSLKLTGHQSVSNSAAATEQKKKTMLRAHEYVEIVQAWLGDVVRAAANKNKFTFGNSKTTNPIFNGIFDSEFAATEHVNLLLETRGR